MRLNKEIAKTIPHSCSECVKNGCCVYLNLYEQVKGEESCKSCQCHEFIPCNMDETLNKIIERFKQTVPLSKDKKLKRQVYAYYDNYHGITDDKVTTLDAYYVGLINDSLDLLRKGKPAYVFKIIHIRDIMRFEQELVAKYIGDGSIELRLRKE